MFFNETFLLELILCLILILLLFNTSPWATLFNAFLYLLFIGILTLTFNASILVGFLWIIDLGLGLILILSLLYFTRAFYSNEKIKNDFSFMTKLNLFIFFTLSLWFFKTNLLTITINYNIPVEVFLINYFDYFTILNLNTISDLSILKFIFINNNLGEFLLINFFLFYGLLFSLSFYFLNTFLSFTLNYKSNFYSKLTIFHKTAFIRLQSFFEQQSAKASIKIWKKKK